MVMARWQFCVCSGFELLTHNDYDMTLALRRVLFVIFFVFFVFFFCLFFIFYFVPVYIRLAGRGGT